MSSLGKKRLEAALAIASYPVGSGTASAAPTPAVEAYDLRLLMVV